MKTINKKQSEKIREGFLKAIEDKKAFMNHFTNGGSVEDFKPKERRNVVRPI